MKCKMCGHQWNEYLCSRCGKGILEQTSEKVEYEYDYGRRSSYRRYFFKCNWCGDKPYYANYGKLLIDSADYPLQYNCPKCNYSNAPKRKKDDGCFITTACVESRNLPDDCYELTLIRGFRDSVLKTNPDLKPIVEEYYLNAPSIVSKINQSSDRERMYEEIYSEMIKPCIKAIENKENKEAIEIYLTYYNELKKCIYNKSDLRFLLNKRG